MDDEQFMAWCSENGYRFNLDPDSGEYYIQMSLEDMQDFYLDSREHKPGSDE